MDRATPALQLKEPPSDDRAQQKLGLFEKLCFAVGGAPYQICNTVIGYFISIFLLDVAQISPYYGSAIIFTSKVWDAITDPICGFLINRAPHTRFGRFKPWIIISAPFACTAYFFLWYVPDFNEIQKFGWYLVCYCLFQILLSGLHVPYTSLTMFISDKQHERDSATAYRMAAEVAGVLLAVIVQGQLVQKYHADQCSGGEATPSPSNNDDLKNAYMVSALVMIGIYIFCAFSVFLGVTERKSLTAVDRSESLFKSIKTVLTYGPYMKLTGAFLMNSLALAQIQGNLALFFTYALDMREDFTYLIIAMLVTSILSIPIWQKVIDRFGKRKAYTAGCIWMLPFVFVMMFEYDLYKWLVYVVTILSGGGVAVAYLLPWSMLPDVLDDFMLKTGTRKDALFYSFFVFFNKLAIGLSLAVSQLVLGISGFDSNECKQSQDVVLALRMLVTPGPFVCLLACLLFIWYYPITEQRRAEIRAAVQAKRERYESETEALRDELKNEEVPDETTSLLNPSHSADNI